MTSANSWSWINAPELITLVPHKLSDQRSLTSEEGEDESVLHPGTKSLTLSRK